MAGSRQVVVGPGDTCSAAGTGDLDMLSTPRVLALLEAAAVDAIGDTLGPALATVGVRVELEHLLPTGIGEYVIASVSLLSIRGRRLIFSAKVLDSQERAIAVGRLTRAVIDRATFGELTS